MSEKVYIVTLKKYEDLEGFYSDMSSGGYKLHMKRPISRNTQYYMTAEQAEEIKKDSRVLDVELNLEDAGLVPAPFALQNNTPYNATGTYRKNSSASAYTATDLDWGKIHGAGNDADRGKGTFGRDGTTSKTATASIFNDGKHVDVVICDNQVSTDCAEWLSPNTSTPTTYNITTTNAGFSYVLNGTDRNGSVSGTHPTVTCYVGDTLNFNLSNVAGNHPFEIRVSSGGAAVSTPAATGQGSTGNATVSWTPNTAGSYVYQCIQHPGMIGTITVQNAVGGSRFKDYDWYTELNSIVGTIDDDGQSIPSAPYNNYFGNATNKTYHGTHVAGTACGKTYGWAREANIYSMQVLGNAAGQGTPVPTLLMFDYLRAFHRYKAVNPITGRRNPTVTNHSWGLISSLESWNINNITEIRWRGASYTQSGNPNPSGWTLNGINADFGLEPGKNPLPGYSSSLNADVEDAIADGVVVIGAAGNHNCYMVPQYNPDGSQHQDWDNYVWFTNQSPSFRYFCRGSSPNSAQGVVTVGNLSSYKNFRRAQSTNYGPNIDVFAPGSNIVSTWGKPGVITDSDGNVLNIGNNDTKYTGDNYFYTISGTSMASPQVAGIAACLSTNKERFTNSDVLGYIQKHSKVGDMTFDVGPTYGQSYYTLNVNAFNSGEYTITGTDKNGSVSGGNPTITCTAGDQLTFIPPPPGSVFCSISAASTSNGYTISWNDRTNWHTGNGQGTNGPTGNSPTINIEVGDAIDFQNAGFNMNSHPLYIKTAPSIGSGDQVTTGTAYGQGTTFSIGWDTATGPTVTPGTYYYVCGAHSGMDGEIVVHAPGTYYNHPLYIKTSLSIGTGNQASGVTNNGTNHNKIPGNLVWIPTVAGTYYYQCSLHSGMNGQIVVQAPTGVLGQNGNFADPTCQKESPNAYILCENPRSTSGNLQNVLGERVTSLKANASRQVFPRTKTIYEQT